MIAVEEGGSQLPTISIVTPTLNQVDYLEETLRSIHEQDYPHLQHIVVDGGSDDGTVQLLKSWNSRLSWWVSEPDRGQAHALNKGFAKATGDVCAYLNSDDYYLPGARNSVGEYFRGNATVDIVHGRCNIVDAQGSFVRYYFSDISHYAQILDLWKVWWGHRHFVQPEVFWCRSAAPGEFNEALYFVMDCEFWVRMLKAGRTVGRLDEPLACFRLTPTQKTQDARGVSEELLDVVEGQLWDLSAPVQHHLMLQGDWLYQRRFLPAVAASEAARHGTALRWVQLAWLRLRTPKIFVSRPLRQRIAALVFDGQPKP
ncbi:MAG: glycosyltransferase [Chromatiales bacterium]|jgi:hypothetical protein|nr:glycosyltransferase [Chromatiales bacterium]